MSESFNEGNRVVHRVRSFFGVLEVKKDDSEEYIELIHGTTLHGMQSLDPERREEPITYYTRNGPVGDVFLGLEQQELSPKKFAVIGLGTGSMSCYAQRGQSLTFYDIDPAVVRIATDPQYFSFVSDCKKRGANVDIVLGDARLRLKDAPAHEYGAIVVDAFSSDSIPIHLLTREALQLYFDKLTEDGILLMHISNRHLNLQPVLGNIAKDIGVFAYHREDRDEKDEPGKSGSDWVVLTRRREYAERVTYITAIETVTEWETPLAAMVAFVSGPTACPAGILVRLTEKKANNWHEAATDPKVGVWTDDYSNLLAVFDWGWQH
jgi:SAM-dependent methyltransferase